MNKLKGLKINIFLSITTILFAVALSIPGTSNTAIAAQEESYARDYQRFEDLADFYITFHPEFSDPTIHPLEEYPDSLEKAGLSIKDPLSDESYKYEKTSKKDFSLTVNFETHEAIQTIKRVQRNYPDLNPKIEGLSVTFTDKTLYPYFSFDPRPSGFNPLRTLNNFFFAMLDPSEDSTYALILFVAIASVVTYGIKLYIDGVSVWRTLASILSVLIAIIVINAIAISTSLAFTLSYSVLSLLGGGEGYEPVMTQILLNIFISISVPYVAYRKKIHTWKIGGAKTPTTDKPEKRGFIYTLKWGSLYTFLTTLLTLPWVVKYSWDNKISEALVFIFAFIAFTSSVSTASFVARRLIKDGTTAKWILGSSVWIIISIIGLGVATLAMISTIDWS